MTMEQDENFFVQINDPMEIRKDILTTSKQVILTLKKYQELRELRKQKMEVMGAYKDTVKEVRMLSNQLTNFLPKTKLRAFVKRTEEKKEQKAVAQDVKKIRKESSGELDKLEMELMSIERKIGRL